MMDSTTAERIVRDAIRTYGNERIAWTADATVTDFYMAWADAVTAIQCGETFEIPAHGTKTGQPVVVGGAHRAVTVRAVDGFTVTVETLSAGAWAALVDAFDGDESACLEAHGAVILREWWGTPDTSEEA